jgi:hypothetical protein
MVADHVYPPGPQGWSVKSLEDVVLASLSVSVDNGAHDVRMGGYNDAIGHFNLLMMFRSRKRRFVNRDSSQTQVSVSDVLWAE